MLCDCKLSFGCSISPAPSPRLLPAPSASAPEVRGSANLGGVALLHQPLLVVRLTQDHVVLQEKLVPHTEPAAQKETRGEETGGEVSVTLASYATFGSLALLALS